VDDDGSDPRGEGGEGPVEAGRAPANDDVVQLHVQQPDWAEGPDWS